MGVSAAMGGGRRRPATEIELVDIGTRDVESGQLELASPARPGGVATV